MEQKNPILEIEDLCVSFGAEKGNTNQQQLRVISNLSMKVYPGEILAVAGSSGSGKSILASAILGILPAQAIVTGKIKFEDSELTSEKQKILRGDKIVLVPQSVAYLDPLMRVGKQVDGYKKPKQTDKRKAIFKKLQLPEQTENLYPYQLSGGMARRVLVSTALIGNAKLVIADEPTPGMTLEQAKTALSMFREMADHGCAVILITHDIDLAFDFADRIAVFYAGTTLEIAPASFFREGPSRLKHPYSKALWHALPQNGFVPIPGVQPYAGSIRKGCLFAPRCPFASQRCKENVPSMRQSGESEVRCFYGTES